MEAKSLLGLPWWWVIEALATSPSVDFRILSELATAAAAHPDLEPGSAATKAAALRCLEALSASHRNKPNSPTSTLLLLKDMILQGSHPLAPPLKEISGLSFPYPIEPSVPSNRHDPLNTLSTNVSAAHGTQPFFQLNTLASENRSNACCVADQLMEIDVTVATSHNVNAHTPPGKKLCVEKQFCVQSQKLSSHYPKHQPRKPKESCLGNPGVEAIASLAKTSEENNISRVPPLYAGGCPDETPAKTNPVSSSQCVFSLESFMLTDTEPNLCMKCNEGGNLLACYGSTCPLMFHESCIASNVGFDDEGNFYCPICAYNRAVSEHTRAKEKVSAARKDLALFIGGGVVTS